MVKLYPNVFNQSPREEHFFHCGCSHPDPNSRCGQDTVSQRPRPPGRLIACLLVIGQPEDFSPHSLSHWLRKNKACAPCYHLKCILDSCNLCGHPPSGNSGQRHVEKYNHPRTSLGKYRPLPDYNRLRETENYSLGLKSLAFLLFLQV